MAPSPADRPSFNISLPTRVLVSGAAGAIGGEIVRRLSAAGCEVIGTDRAENPPDGFPGRLWLGGDITLADDRRRILEGVGAPIDGAVLAAGVLDSADWRQIDQAAAESLLAVNLLAPFFITRDLIPGLAPDASVVILGSIAGARASPGTPLYGASKAGLRNLSASLALLLQPFGARVNLLAPGLIDTLLTSQLNAVRAEELGVDVETIMKERTASIPLARAGTVTEVADAALFLLSPVSSYFSGASLYMTGGALAGGI